ncbi:casein kinase 1-like protein HD16 [Eucalyptus grandis]|uniref:casein kinase 1-like protein HD16 n=1 Tax=Eucalyptus grandis TaxID=71139 RepID=UPI00192EF6B6|nr:casein kinase 1-like protein HD16 [Eucalyptus grandis]
MENLMRITKGNKVMDLLGPSLQPRFVNNFPNVPLEAIAYIAVEVISILEKLHFGGYIHGDIILGKFLLGPPGTPEERRLFLTDLGLVTRWRDPTIGSHVKYYQTPDDIGFEQNDVSISCLPV